MIGNFRPISISLSPNTEKDDIDLALKLIFQPWRWKEGKDIGILEKEFKKHFGTKHAVSFNSGRSAFLAILKSLGLQENTEVLLQAFTCNAAVSPILWANLKPAYVDCKKETFNIDTENLQKKVTQASKILVIQHTFGLAAEMEKILEICQRNNLILIEDCAHSLGTSYRGKKVGTFGKAAFFSFSRDKIISSVYGGMVITDDDILAKKLKEFQEKVSYPSNFWIFQQLLHPVLMSFLILPTYSFLRLGKTLLSVFQWLQILSKAVHWTEKKGKKPGYFPKKMPNVLSFLALNQLRKLERFNNHRRKIANFYYNNLRNTSFELLEKSEGQVFLRFTIKHSKAHQIIKKAWQENILIGDWYTTPIAPHDTNLEKMKYISGSCPRAEKLAKETLNLPTHINISQEEAKKIVDFLIRVTHLYF
ncbi:MAG TPA: DegT/DnrJ/EryC1/StrS aminotransferase family protein [Candidatus Nealsonbacteria bacterium]|uniref:DegT/DnrJ/EryC1/StrS aminotransferase n=1 Tax=marine sediment metagenome TaxID=412755 RepID=A0A0F9YEE0_9ZZZZ|nr:DegT/DnrJ/EryC1/StrS aminotransferase family protein [Candidatus Nealsonbacteria bacterium]HEB46489.1 DegT/DnrJ/EryC1/StrS aminotransferase family protein [Candidatus Nealsonbacteria bacterium]